MRERARGFTILELLVVVAIIGIIAAIAIWNYWDAVQRARQKRTMADMHTIAMAWEARAVDTRAYNAAGFTMPAAPVTGAQITAILVPTYIKVMPVTDGWGGSLQFTADQPIGGANGATTYAIRSAGADKTFSGTTYVPGPTTGFDCDIVYSGGAFVVYPDGIQQQ